jgi:hypothetical protein
MKKIIWAVMIFACPFSVRAQTESEKIKETIDGFFKAMYASDTVAMHGIMHKNATFNTVVISADKPARLDELPLALFYKSIGAKRPNMTLEERLLDHKINIDEDLAVDWTPYEFYINGKLSHKGTNVFTLVKVDQKWQIKAIIDTRKK